MSTINFQARDRKIEEARLARLAQQREADKRLRAAAEQWMLQMRAWDWDYVLDRVTANGDYTLGKLEELAVGLSAWGFSKALKVVAGEYGLRVKSACQAFDVEYSVSVAADSRRSGSEDCPWMPTVAVRHQARGNRVADGDRGEALGGIRAGAPNRAALHLPARSGFFG
jgi:hypothetical protein